RIPQDIAIAGIDDSRICGVLEPELTSVRIDCDEMGRASAKMMLSLLAGAEAKAGAAGAGGKTGKAGAAVKEIVVLQPKLTVRNST
ncbi:MAG: substrate-binding domain-containing protein, partial [Eubacteriales bacterium]|nr:substrate-binding domain-containing protein [Eubacteriales bacterium]